MDERRTARLNIVLTPEEMAMLEALARANTGQNKSMMLRTLIAKAWQAPKTLGLHSPKGLALTASASQRVS